MKLEDLIGGLIPHLPDGVVLLDPSGLVQYMNASAERMTEATTETARYRHWRSVFSVKVEDTAHDQTGSLIDILLERPTLITKSGRKIPIELEIVPIADDEGTAVGSMLLLHDVTSSNTEKEGLKESRAKYKRLVNTIEGIVWEAEGEEMRIRFVSDFAEKLLGFSPKNWIKDPLFWQNLIHKDDRASVLEVITNSLQQREDYQIEYRVITASGATLLVRDSVTIYAQDGHLRISGVMTDITSAKQAREALIQSEERFSAAFDANPTALVLITESGKILDANESFERATGYFRDQIINQTVEYSGLCSLQEYASLISQIGGKDRIQQLAIPFHLRIRETTSVSGSARRITLENEPCVIIVLHG